VIGLSRRRSGTVATCPGIHLRSSGLPDNVAGTSSGCLELADPVINCGPAANRPPKFSRFTSLNVPVSRAWSATIRFKRAFLTPGLSTALGHRPSSPVLLASPVKLCLSDLQVFAHLHQQRSFTQQTISLPKLETNLLRRLMPMIHIVLLAQGVNVDSQSNWIN